jgi:GxxExxY protein
MDSDSLTGRVIGCAIEVHRHLGPGLLESSYEHCLAYELTQNQIAFLRQHPIPLNYKGIQLDCGYKIDLLVEGQLILELKSIGAIEDIHRAQILTYLKLANIKTGLLINFNVQLLKDGIERFVI